MHRNGPSQTSLPVSYQSSCHDVRNGSGPYPGGAFSYGPANMEPLSTQSLQNFVYLTQSQMSPFVSSRQPPYNFPGSIASQNIASTSQSLSCSGPPSFSSAETYMIDVPAHLKADTQAAYRFGPPFSGSAIQGSAANAGTDEIASNVKMRNPRARNQSAKRQNVGQVSRQSKRVASNAEGHYDDPVSKDSDRSAGTPVPKKSRNAPKARTIQSVPGEAVGNLSGSKRMPTVTKGKKFLQSEKGKLNISPLLYPPTDTNIPVLNLHPGSAAVDGDLGDKADPMGVHNHCQCQYFEASLREQQEAIGKLKPTVGELVATVQGHKEAIERIELMLKEEKSKHLPEQHPVTIVSTGDLITAMDNNYGLHKNTRPVGPTTAMDTDDNSDCDYVSLPETRNNSFEVAKEPSLSDVVMEDAAEPVINSLSVTQSRKFLALDDF